MSGPDSGTRRRSLLCVIARGDVTRARHVARAAAGGPRGGGGAQAPGKARDSWKTAPLRNALLFFPPVQEGWMASVYCLLNNRICRISLLCVCWSMIASLSFLTVCCYFPLLSREFS